MSHLQSQRDTRIVTSPCISPILGDPSYSSYAEDNDSYRYTAPVKIIQNGKVKRTYHPLILVSADSYNVITAYPRK